MFEQVDVDAYGMLHLQGPDPYVPEAGMYMRLQSKEPSFLIYEIPRGPAARGEKKCKKLSGRLGSNRNIPYQIEGAQDYISLSFFSPFACFFPLSLLRLEPSIWVM